MAATLKSLYYDFSLNYRNKSDDYFIDFYISNALFFNNIKNFKDVDELVMYMQITCRFANAFFNKSRFNECVETCDKNLTVIDNEIVRLNTNEVKDAWYYSILFAKGRSCYNLKDFKSSTPIFKILVSHDYQNESYKNWLNYSKYRRITRYFNISAVIIPICVLIEIFFKNPIPRIVMRSMFAVFFLMLIIILAYNYYLERNLRKKT